MKGVIILAHGSKRQETEKILNSLTEKVKNKTGESLIYPAYLQFSEQDMEAGADYLVKKGATEIIVIPLLLFDGIHVTQSIPNKLSEIKDKYHGINIRLSHHLGDDDRIAEIISDRVRSFFD